MRPYDQELATCRRYYQKYPNYLVNTGAGQSMFGFPAMRVLPAVTGGGAGFATPTLNIDSMTTAQTTPAFVTLVLDARF
jgi:hypothetical protein